MGVLFLLHEISNFLGSYQKIQQARDLQKNPVSRPGFGPDPLLVFS